MNPMTDTLLLILILVPCLVIAIVFHEVAHGYVAKLLGDTTASDRGRLTLNPIRHVDPIGTLLVPGALALAGGPVFGWAKPVPIMKSRLRNPRFGMMAVAAAGPMSNFVLALAGAVALGLAAPVDMQFAQSDTGLLQLQTFDGQLLVAATGLFYFILINVFLGLFNLLPIPPFDGSHIVGGLLPDRLRRPWERLQRLGMVLILAVVAFSWVFGTGWLAATLGTPLEYALEFFVGIARAIAGA